MNCIDIFFQLFQIDWIWFSSSKCFIMIYKWLPKNPKVGTLIVDIWYWYTIIAWRCSYMFGVAVWWWTIERKYSPSRSIMELWKEHENILPDILNQVCIKRISYWIYVTCSVVISQVFFWILDENLKTGGVYEVTKETGIKIISHELVGVRHAWMDGFR